MLASVGGIAFLIESRCKPTAVGRYTHLEKFRSSKNPFQRVLGRLRRGETPHPSAKVKHPFPTFFKKFPHSIEKNYHTWYNAKDNDKKEKNK